jgi:ribosome-binding factor A
MADRIGKPITQRQLRVGEMIKQSLSMIFIRNEAKVPNLETKTITVTEVRMSQDLPKLLFRKDESFEYAEKIENLIKQTNK